MVLHKMWKHVNYIWRIPTSKKRVEFWAEYNLWGSVWPTKDLADGQTLKTDLIRDWKATSNLSEKFRSCSLGYLWTLLSQQETSWLFLFSLCPLVSHTHLFSFYLLPHCNSHFWIPLFIYLVSSYLGLQIVAYDSYIHANVCRIW